MSDVVRIPFDATKGFPPERDGDLTSSVIGAAFGLDPYKTIGQVVAALRGLKADHQDSVPMRRGRALEPVVAQLLADARPDLEIWKANEYLRDPVLRLGASPDYYARTNEPKKLAIEIKTTTKRRFDQLWGDGPPVHYALQIAVAMMLDDADAGIIAALIFDEYHFELRTFDVPRHAGAEKRIVETVKNFWADFDAGIPPKVDFERDGDLIALMYPVEVEAKVIDLRADNRIQELLVIDERLSAEAKELETARKAVANEIKMKIGDAESALVNGWRVTFKTQSRKGFEVKPTSFRVLKSKREVAA